MANLSQEKRQRMLKCLDEIRETHKDDDNLLIAINEIESELTAKRYGLIWERHQEDVDVKMVDYIPVFTECKDREINNIQERKYNFILEGDNLHSLYLLEKTHREKIDIIYIDPPYNTGNNDFVYSDKTVDENDTFRHSKWLSFMEARLKIAKRLLTDSGVIFISIDDNEMTPLKLLCDDIFGSGNFISLYPRLTVKGGKTQTSLSTHNIDYVLAYARDINKTVFNKIVIEDDPAFKYTDEYLETRGKFHTKQALDTVSLGYVASLDYPIVHDGKEYYPGGVKENNGYRWTWSKDKYDFALENDFIVFKNNRIFPKKYSNASIEKNENGYYIKYEQKAKNYSQIHFLDNCYSNTNGTIDLQKLGLQSLFSYAKPVSLVKDLLRMSSSRDATVLDFFAGSGTTGHAVMDLNAEDGGNRRFILCTNNENNICEEVTYERIKRVINGYGDIKAHHANVKYFRTEFVPKDSEEITEDLLNHICEMIELENGIKLDGHRYIILLSDEDAEELERHWSEYSDVKELYVSKNVLFTSSQKNIFGEIETHTIPDYYFKFEMQEVGEAW